MGRQLRDAMFVELAEYLRCPTDPDESYCVVASDEMVGRSIIRGSVGCPATKKEYYIESGVADFTTRDTPPLPIPSSKPEIDAQTVQAVLGIGTPGGYFVLFGSAAWLAPALSDLIGGVHFVGLNVPDGVEPSPTMSALRGPYPVPLRSAMARGVVVGSEFAKEPWLSEAGRLLLKGLRVAVLKQGASVPGTDRLASGQGMWVGQKI